MIDHTELLRTLDYTPETGEFRWRAGQHYVGRVAGSKAKSGYVAIQIHGQLYYAHRLAWMYVTGAWPKADIDHINGDRSDNRLSNLREASRSQNNANQKLGGRNSSGYRGVSFHKASRKWNAQIHHNSRRIHLGLFESAEAAHTAYLSAASTIYGAYLHPVTKKV